MTNGATEFATQYATTGVNKDMYMKIDSQIICSINMPDGANNEKNGARIDEFTLSKNQYVREDNALDFYTYNMSRCDSNCELWAGHTVFNSGNLNKEEHMILTILASVNLLGGVADQLVAKVDQANRDARPAQTESKKCEDGLFLNDLCDPVCEHIFSYISDKDQARKEAIRIFRDVMACDNVCTCICESVCDEFM